MDGHEASCIPEESTISRVGFKPPFRRPASTTATLSWRIVTAASERSCPELHRADVVQRQVAFVFSYTPERGTLTKKERGPSRTRERLATDLPPETC